MRALPFIYLSHIAVAKAMRSKGLGNQLLNLLIERARTISTSPSYFAMVWEVEDPKHALNANDKTLRERRISFYQKAGAKFLPGQFIQPPVDGIHSIPMRLMYCPLNLDRDIYSQEKEIMHAIYFEKYHVVNKITTDIIQNLWQQSCSPIAPPSSK